MILFLFLPVLVGMIWHVFLQWKEKEWGLIYLYGSLTELVIAGIVAMPAIKLKASFLAYRTAALTIISALAVCGLILWLRCMKSTKAGWRVKVETERGGRWVWLIVAGIFLLLAANFFSYMPAVQTDMTAEMIHTTIRTNTLFEYNPATGELLNLGIYPQDKLVTLPLFYSLFYSLATDGQMMEMQHFLYELVPCWVLFLNFLVFLKWGERLFLGQQRQRLRLQLFLCFYGAANLFGDYLFNTFSYKLLHQAWTGEAILVTVILPLLFFQLCNLMQGEKEFRELQQDKRTRRKVAGLALCMLSALFSAPWREAVVLCGMVVTAGAITAVIWRRLHERNN